MHSVGVIYSLFFVLCVRDLNEVNKMIADVVNNRSSLNIGSDVVGENMVNQGEGVIIHAGGFEIG